MACHAWPSFHFAPCASCRKPPVSSNVRHHPQRPGYEMDPSVCCARVLCVAAREQRAPFPAVEILQGPPPGNYCQSNGVPALFNVNTRPGRHIMGGEPCELTVSRSPKHNTFVRVSGWHSFRIRAMPPSTTPGSSTRRERYSVQRPPTLTRTKANLRERTRHPMRYGQTVLIRNTDLTPPPPLPVPISPGPVAIALLLVSAFTLRRSCAQQLWCLTPRIWTPSQ